MTDPGRFSDCLPIRRLLLRVFNRVLPWAIALDVAAAILAGLAIDLFAAWMVVNALIGWLVVVAIVFVPVFFCEWLYHGWTGRLDQAQKSVD